MQMEDKNEMYAAARDERCFSRGGLQKLDSPPAGCLDLTSKQIPLHNELVNKLCMLAPEAGNPDTQAIELRAFTIATAVSIFMR